MFVNSSDNGLSNRVLDGSGVTELDFFRKDVYDFGILLLGLIIGVRLNLINHLVGFIPCQICLYFSS